MKQILSIFVFFVFAMANQAYGLDIFKKGDNTPFNYSAWSDTTDLVREVDGRTLFYPKTSEGEAFVSGEIKVPGQSADKIFLAALNYAADNLDATDGHEQIGEIKPEEKSFMLRQFSHQGTNNNESTFTRLTLVKAENGNLVFRSTELDVKYREKGLIPRTLAFEKLNPATKTRHRELVEQYADINSRYFHDMAAAVPESGKLEVTHWKEIADKEVVKGMNRFEAKLILGKPITERDNGDRVRWIYPKNYVLLFTKGKLTRIIE